MSQDFATLALRVQQAGAAQTEKSLRSVAREANKLAREFKKVEEATKGSTDATKGAADATDKAANANEKLDRGLTRSSGRLKVIGRDINRYLVLPLTALIGLSSRAALSLNEGLGAVQTLIPTAGGRIYELRDGIKDLAQESGRSMKELNDGLYQTISVFQDNADTMDRVTTATKMAIAGYSSTTDAVNLLAAVTRAYGDTSAAAVEKVADLSFETVRLGATTIPQLSGAMQVATDRAVRLSVSQEELFTVMATLTGITGDASMVATQFRSAMDSLLNPTDSMVELLDKMGYASAEAAIQELGLVTVIKAINDAAEASGKPLQDFITRKEGITLVSRLATQQFEDYNDKLEDITDHHGAAARSFDVVRDGVAKYNFQLNVARQRASVLAAEIGEKMLPSLVVLATTLVDVLEAFSKLPDILQSSLVGFTALSAGVSILYQLRGVIQSFIQYNVFSGFLAGITKVTGGAVLLKGVLSTLFPVLGVLAAATAAVSVGIIRHNRAVEESARQAEERLQSLAELSESRMDMGAGRDVEVVERAERMRQGGLMPSVADGENITAMSYKAMMELSPSQRRELINQYQQQLEGLLAESGKIQTDVISDFGGQFIGRAQTVARDISDYLNDRWVTETFGRTTSGGEARRNAIHELLREDDIDLNALITMIREQIRELEQEYEVRDGLLAPDWVGTRYSRTTPEEPRKQYEALNQALEDINYTISQTDKWNNYAEAAGDTEHEVVQLLAALSLLEEAQTADEDSLMTWQQWFAQVTDIAAVAAVRTGNHAADLFISSWESKTAEDRNVLGFFDIPMDEEQVLRDRLQDITSTLREAVSNKGVDIPIELGDELSLRLLEEYETKLNDLSEVALANLIEEFEKADTEMESFNEMIEKFGLNIDHATFSQDDFTDRVQEVTDVLEELVSLGLDPSSEAAKAFTDYINGMAVPVAHSTSEVEKLIDSLGEQNKTFGYSERGMFLYSLTLMDDVTPAQKKAALEQYDLGVALKETATEVELMDEVMKNFVTSLAESGTRMFADTLFDISVALGEGALEADNAADMYAQLGLQLMKLIPQLMIAAGLQLLIASLGTNPMGWALLAMGLAGTVAAGFAQGAYNKEKDKSEGSAKGNVFNEGSIVPFARGGAFTNSIVDSPTIFPMAKGAGLMGEDGPEAILPLQRTPSGELGVKGEGSQVNVIINNNSGEEVQHTERTTSGGGREIEITIGGIVKKHLSEGRLDTAMRQRYGLENKGVR